MRGIFQAFLRQALCSCTMPVFLYNSAAAPTGQTISPELYKALAADFHHIVAGIHDASSSSSSSSSGGNAAATVLDLPRRYKAAVPHLPVHVSTTSAAALHTLLIAAGAAEGSSSSSSSEQQQQQQQFHIICAAASVAPEAFTRLSEAVKRRDAPAAASAESRLKAWCSYASSLSVAAAGGSSSSSSSSSDATAAAAAAGNIAILKAGVAARVPGFGTGTRAPIVPLSSVQAKRVLQWFADDGLGKAELSDKVNRASQSFKAKVDAYTAGWNSVEVAALEALTAKVNCTSDWPGSASASCTC
jgi:hypothetical protein